MTQLLFLYMVQKDVSVLLRDRKALAILLAMPLILTTVPGFALGPPPEECKEFLRLCREPDAKQQLVYMCFQRKVA